MWCWYVLSCQNSGFKIAWLPWIIISIMLLQHLKSPSYGFNFIWNTSQQAFSINNIELTWNGSPCTFKMCRPKIDAEMINSTIKLLCSSCNALINLSTTHCGHLVGTDSALALFYDEQKFKFHFHSEPFKMKIYGIELLVVTRGIQFLFSKTNVFLRSMFKIDVTVKRVLAVLSTFIRLFHASHTFSTFIRQLNPPRCNTKWMFFYGIHYYACEINNINIVMEKMVLILSIIEHEIVRLISDNKFEMVL